MADPEFCPFTNILCVYRGFECPDFGDVDCSVVHEVIGDGTDLNSLFEVIPQVPKEWIQRAKQIKELKAQTFTMAALRSMPYEQYLLTPHWQETAKRARKRARYACEKCGRKPGRGHLHVHHKTYANRGNEKPKDLLVLCESCHKVEHGKQA